MKYTLLTLFLLCMNFTNAYAQEVTALAGDNKEPVEISADKTLEWHQNDKQYIADGNAEAKQGDVIITADKLIADYRDDNKGGNVEIWQLTANEKVTIKNADSTIVGDTAVYNIDSAIATLTGNNLKLTMPDQIITARESMEYDSANGIAKAIGNAKITRANDTLTAQTITANFTKDTNGKQALTTAKADGGVTIATPTETLTGDYGIYNATNNTAEVKGNVKIVRGPNILEGARAEINLTTSVSKMFGAPETGKRVKGIFFPGSSDLNNSKKEGGN